MRNTCPGLHWWRLSTETLSGRAQLWPGHYCLWFRGTSSLPGKEGDGPSLLGHGQWLVVASLSTMHVNVRLFPPADVALVVRAQL